MRADNWKITRDAAVRCFTSSGSDGLGGTAEKLGEGGEASQRRPAQRRVSAGTSLTCNQTRNFQEEKRSSPRAEPVYLGSKRSNIVVLCAGEEAMGKKEGSRREDGERGRNCRAGEKKKTLKHVLNKSRKQLKPISRQNRRRKREESVYGPTGLIDVIGRPTANQGGEEKKRKIGKICSAGDSNGHSLRSGGQLE